MQFDFMFMRSQAKVSRNILKFYELGLQGKKTIKRTKYLTDILVLAKPIAQTFLSILSMMIIMLA